MLPAPALCRLLSSFTNDALTRTRGYFLVIAVIGHFLGGLRLGCRELRKTLFFGVGWCFAKTVN
jgi:hypothetical protein